MPESVPRTYLEDNCCWHWCLPGGDYLQAVLTVLCRAEGGEVVLRGGRTGTRDMA